MKRNKLLRLILVYSEYIINYSFYIYTSVYTGFILFRKSIVYNYLFLFFLGLFLGYRFAVIARNYLRCNGTKGL
jgi:hypothetical protein